MIKTVLAMRHRTIPPVANFRQPNPHIDFASTPFHVSGEASPWQPGGPRMAGVSAFGVGGVNAHVVLEEGPATLAGNLRAPCPTALCFRPFRGRARCGVGQPWPPSRGASGVESGGRFLYAPDRAARIRSSRLGGMLQRGRSCADACRTREAADSQVRGHPCAAPAGLSLHRPGRAVSRNGPRALPGGACLSKADRRMRGDSAARCWISTCEQYFFRRMRTARHPPRP